jgi:hypothetical protein
MGVKRPRLAHAPPVLPIQHALGVYHLSKWIGQQLFNPVIEGVLIDFIIETARCFTIECTVRTMPVRTAVQYVHKCTLLLYSTYSHSPHCQCKYIISSRTHLIMPDITLYIECTKNM